MKLSGSIKNNFLFFVFILIFLQLSNAEGVMVHENSFEDLVHGSTNIIIGKIILNNTDTTNDFEYPTTTVKIIRKIKGDITDSTIVLKYIKFRPWDFELIKGQNYLLFLKPDNSNHFWIFSNDYYVCWKVVNDSLQNLGHSKHNITLFTNDFVLTIQKEQHRNKIKLPKGLFGINIGDSLNINQEIAGLKFVQYKDQFNQDKWKRYYCLLPTDSAAHMIQFNVQKNKIVFLGIYYLNDIGDCSKMPINNLVSMCGGLDLSNLNEVDCFIGRRWFDENVDIEIRGNFRFIKANGFPWGTFDASYITFSLNHQNH